MATDANSGKPAFAAYLENSPKITDTTDPIQCGSARSYFGFQSNYINDAGICLDIAQFKSTPNFDFLEEFFNQGSDAAAAAGEDAEMPDFYLTPIDRSKYQ